MDLYADNPVFQIRSHFGLNQWSFSSLYEVYCTHFSPFLTHNLVCCHFLR